MAKDKDRVNKIPLHKRLGVGSEMGRQEDQEMVVTIARAYLDQIEAGEMVVEHISEIDLGEGRYIRTFVIQE